MKRFYLLSALFLFSIAIIAQNQVWTLPGKYLKSNTIISLPTDLIVEEWDGYTGQQSNYAHNAIHKTNGDIWFFIVDGILYNGQGQYIGLLKLNQPNDGLFTEGLSEVCVVPDPANCNRFYIFSTDVSAADNSPTYSYLDLSIPTDIFYNEALQGRLFSFEDNNGFDDGHSDAGTAIALSTLGLEYNIAPKLRNVTYAASDVVSDANGDKRYVFVKIDEKIYTIVIDQTGIHYQTGQFLDLSQITGIYYNSSGHVRTELELFENTNGTFRLGFSLPSSTNTYQKKAIIGTVDLDENGIFEANSESYYAYPNNSDNLTKLIIRGLEFSESGNYLYFTHNTDQFNTNPFEYFDVLNGGNPVAVNGINVNNYKYSHIEKDATGKLYLANANGMATLNNANNPGSLVWTDQAISFSGFSYNLSYGNSNSNNTDAKAYTLPDQIDGMDYVAYIEEDYECCIDQYTFDVASYQTTGTDVWKPNDNPLNNSSGNIVTIQEELRIAAGHYIRIDDMELRFAPGASLIIESTGYLRLRNTKLTNIDACGVIDLWEGVKVEGTTSSTQTTSYQGRLMMQSSSSIENALIGVTTEVDGLSQSGGIITASGSDFINNVQDVVFMAHPGNNISYFSGCEFKTTEDYLGDYTTQVPVHVTLNEVDNVSFNNADFLEQRNGLNINTQGATGILGSQSSFEVKSGSDFTGLKNGIRAFGQTNASYQVLIDNSVFYNRYNIYLEDFTGAEVLENYITVDPDDPISGQYQKYPYGIYLQHCFDYQVEENKLFSSSDRATIGQSLGIVIRNNHEQSEEIYLNEFTMFSVAIEPLDQNRSDKPKDNFQGLQIRCNEFNNCMWDISVLPGDTPPFGVLLGIAYEQGRPASGQIGTEDLGGNLFTVQNYSSLAFNYYNHNDMEYVVYELHNNQIQYPRIYPWEFFNNNNFQPNINGSIAYDSLLSCPSNINGGGGSSSDLLVLKNSSQTEYETSSAVLNSEVDGGSTAQMEGVVATTTEQTAWNGYQKLMDEQGYLSNEVLEDVGEKEDGLSNAMIRNVLVANPASAKSNEVQEKLDNRLNPLPDYMRYQIDQGINQISAREAMEQLVSGHKYNRDKAIKKGVHLVLSDTLLSDIEKKNQLIEFYANTGDKNHEIKIAMLHDRFGETQLADEIYESLLFESQGTAFAAELEEYLEYRTLISGWNAITDLNADQLLLLDSYSLGGQMTASKARGLLVLNGVEVDPEPTVMPEEGDKSFGGKEESKWDTAFDNTMMLIYPNPTEHFVTLRYTVAETFNQLIVVVLDVKGNAVWNKKLHYDQDEIIIKMENLPTGNYYIQLLKDGQTLKTEKVTLVK